MKRARQGSSGDDGLPGKHVFLNGDRSGRAAKASLASLANSFESRELQDLNSGSNKASIENSAYNKQMHLAGSTLGGARIATRSKTRQIEESNHVVSLNAATAAAPADAVQHAPALVAVTSDLQSLKPTAISSNQQAGPAHQGAFLPAANKRAVVQSASSAAAAACAPRTAHLQQLPSDDLQHILDSAAASRTSSRLVHPSLLRHAGVGKHAHAQPPQRSPLRAANAAATATATALPALKKHSSIAANGITGTIRSHRHTSSDGSGGNSKHSAAGQATRSAVAAAAAESSATTTSKRSGTRRVQFAPGPLSNATARTMISADGHPATEGALAVPVRRLPQSYPVDLTRGNVLMLENLLGSDCAQSVTRLKRRVGLLPPIRPPRPHVCSRPAGRAAPFDGEEETAGSVPAAAAGVGDCGREDAKHGTLHELHLPPAAAHPPKLPGRARVVPGRIESCM